MPSLSIVIPAYNEADRLPVTLAAIHSFLQKDAMDIQEIIVVDDGSIDDTSVVTQSWLDRLPITLHTLPSNQGKGAALRAGVLMATGDYVLLYDADGATPPEEIHTLMQECMQHRCDIVIGSRIKGATQASVCMPMHRRIIGRVYHALCLPLTGPIQDAACGCKLLRTATAHALFRQQHINRFAYDVEILALARRMHCSLREVPVRWKAIHGSKINLIRDGLNMCLCILWLYTQSIRRLCNATH